VVTSSKIARILHRFKSNWDKFGRIFVWRIDWRSRISDL